MNNSYYGWSGLSRNKLEDSAWGYANSCFHEHQLMKIADGSFLTASAIAEAVRNGHRIDFLTPDLSGVKKCANPVIGVVNTLAKGVKIIFQDGRSVRLTNGHVLPLSNQRTELFSDKQNIPVHEQWTIFAGQVKPGMVLFDGKVEAVKQLGKINAVRLWTAHPAWVHTHENLSVGTRWHEVLHAWIEVGIDEEWGDELYPLSATGWLWGNGIRPITGRGEYQDLLLSPIENNDKVVRQIHLAELGRTENVREAMTPNRWQTNHRFSYLPKKILRRNASKEEAKVYPYLAWVRPKGLTEQMISGVEVIGTPVITDYVATKVAA